MFFVRHGASNPLAVFFPTIPPKPVSGKPTAYSAQSRGEERVKGVRDLPISHIHMIRTIVVNGKA